MALHDFICSSCGHVERDVNVPAAIGARDGAPLHQPCQVRMTWIPQVGRMDFGPAGGAGFKAFTIEEEVRGRPQRIEIDSTHKLRQVEREFETHARNGEARPLVWRDYSQTKSNGDVHTLCKTPGDPHQVKAEIDRVKVKNVQKRVGAEVAKTHGTI